jgi:hypothetical protein
MCLFGGYAKKTNFTERPVYNLVVAQLINPGISGLGNRVMKVDLDRICGTETQFRKQHSEIADGDGLLDAQITIFAPRPWPLVVHLLNTDLISNILCFKTHASYVLLPVNGPTVSLK